VGPIIVAVDAAELLSVIESELKDRYSRHYRVVCVSSAPKAVSRLEELADAGEDVALVLAGSRLSGTTGTELLGRARRLHPHARLCLLIGWGEWGADEAGSSIFDALGRGRLDYYIIRPSSWPDEQFHMTVASFLLEWAETRRRAPHTVQVVGETWSGRAYELRQVLGRCAMPHAFLLADSEEGRAVMARAGTEDRLPLIVMPDGRVLADPTDAKIAEASGTTVQPRGDVYDLVIIGCGPAGLSAAVYGASEGLRTLVIDKGAVGGQATSSSSIRNYLGFPRGISGRLLARQAFDQAWLFGARFAFMQEVTELRPDVGRVVLGVDNGGQVGARAVVLATGASYRRLGVPELEALTGSGVVYGAAASEALAVAGQDVFVVGGANSAGQAALHLANYARRVTLVVRAVSLDAGMSRYLVRHVEATHNIDVRLRTEVVGGGGQGWLEHLVLRDRASGDTHTVSADGLFLMIGAYPHTDWLPSTVARDKGGYVVTGSELSAEQVTRLDRQPLPLETSLPRLLAVGDVRHGSVKRVASAVGEGSVAIQQVHRLLTERNP
jgi:thioredoxin reductase (NADPH)